MVCVANVLHSLYDVYLGERGCQAIGYVVKTNTTLTHLEYAVTIMSIDAADFISVGSMKASTLLPML